MGFFSKIKNFFSGKVEDKPKKNVVEEGQSDEYQKDQIPLPSDDAKSEIVKEEIKADDEEPIRQDSLREENQEPELVKDRVEESEGISQREQREDDISKEYRDKDSESAAAGDGTFLFEDDGSEAYHSPEKEQGTDQSKEDTLEKTDDRFSKEEAAPRKEESIILERPASLDETPLEEGGLSQKKMGVPEERESAFQDISQEETSQQEESVIQKRALSGEKISFKEEYPLSQKKDNVIEQKERLTETGTDETWKAASENKTDDAETSLILRLREAPPKLSSWLNIVLEGVEEKGDLLNERLTCLLQALDAPKEEADSFISDFSSWLDRMDYTYLEEFRSELQYRLALALELEDEEDERNRLLVKIQTGLSKTREQLMQKLDSLFAEHGAFDDAFWEHLEEVFITADLGYEASLALVERLKNRVRITHASQPEQLRDLLREELREIFRIEPRITAYDPPEVILMVGVNGVGKTTTIGKLAHRARMQGRKVMIAAGDTFRAAAIEQLEVWAKRAGALFHSRPQGSDPASVAYEAMDRALKEGVDLLFIDTAGRLQTKVNLMEELKKIRLVTGKKHKGAPHRTILVIDATTGQNALSQVKLFQEACQVDELIVTKLDGTAKGGFAIALALQFHLPITYIGLGEKIEDLRPFNGEDFANALLSETHQKSK